MKKALLIIPLVIVLFLGGGLFMKEKQPNSQNTLRLALPNDVSTLHFSASSRGYLLNSSHVVNMLFEGLMRRDERNMPVPAVASRVEVSRDLRTYTFYIRDCKWSDGTPISAEDFEYSWKRAVDPQSKAITPSPYYYYPILNAKKCLMGQCSPEEVGVHAADKQTLVVELEYPAPYFLELVAHPFLFPAPKHVAEKDPSWANGPGLVCNGPFFLEEWRRNSEMQLKKNPQYWDQEHVYLDGIHVSVVSDSLTALQLFQKGELDWIGSPFFTLSYDVSHDLLNEEYEDVIIYWIAFNTEKPPFHNKKLRKALSYAINRKAITENVFHRSATPRMSALPSPLRLSNQPYFPDNNQAEAKWVFREALLELDLKAEELPEIELIYGADIEFASRITQAVQDQWKQVLGIEKVRLRPYESNVYFNNVTKGDYEMGFMGWVSLICDQLFILNCFMNKTDLMNKTNWESPAFADLIEQSNQALGEIERIKILSEAETILMDEMPVIPICSLNKRFAKHPKLKGEIVSPVQAVDFKSAYFQK